MCCYLLSRASWAEEAEVNVDGVSVTRFGEILTLWQKRQNALTIFRRLIQLLAKFWHYLSIIICYWGNFHSSKQLNIKNSSAIRSHWSSYKEIAETVSAYLGLFTNYSTNNSSCGFVCAFHPAAPGSSPKHTIYAFFNLYLSFELECERDENKQKEAGIGPFLNK